MKGLVRAIACSVPWMALVLAASAHADGRYTIAYATFAPLNTGVFIANGDGTQQRLLNTTPNFESNPAFSPDGRWVLFTSRRNGSADIYRVRIDGSALERLTDDDAFDDQAAMSPDGKRIAFVSSRSGRADIWILELKSRRLYNLTRDPGGDYRPAWSPDGNWIAFTSDRDSAGAQAHTGANFAPRQNTQIYLVRSDGSELRRLTQGELSVGGAGWSPDGKTIVFYEATARDWVYLGRTFPSPVTVSQIASIDVATGARSTLTRGAGRKLTPQWLRDGRIAYVSSDTPEERGANNRALDYSSERIRFADGGVGPEGIFVSPHWSPDGKRLVFHRFVDEAAAPIVRAHSRDPDFDLIRTGAFPSFSPDGRSLAYTDIGFRLAGFGARNAESRQSSNESQIYVVDIDGTHRRTLHAEPGQATVGPAWSPDGKGIAFGIGPVQVRPDHFGPAKIVMVDSDGSGLRRLTPDDTGNYQFPSWSPDGKKLVLRVAQPVTKGLSILDVESGTLSPLTPESSTDNLPAWSPRGDAIAFTSNRDGDWEIYRIAPDGTGITRLTDSAGNDAHPAWSPDGQWIAFGSARGGFKDEMPRGGGGQGATDIFVMRADGSDVRQLTDDAAEEGTPTFAPVASMVR